VPGEPLGDRRSSLATAQGDVDVIIQDESATLALSASGILLPSVISLPPAQSAQVWAPRASAIIMVMRRETRPCPCPT
jgi:integral membrane sensor domain MASE1